MEGVRESAKDIMSETDRLDRWPRDLLTGEIKGRLFKSFPTTKSTGTGLGLALSRHLVEHFNGSLDITSESGQEVTATVSLPLSRRS
jgi:nitrogen-specific signal transduction histidine kinase